MRLSRLFLWAMPVTLLVSAGVFVAALAWPGGDLQRYAFVAGMNTLLFLAVALPCSVARERGRHPRLMLSGIVAAGAAVAGLAIGEFMDMDAEAGRWFVWPMLWGGLMMGAGLLALPRPRAGWWKWARRGTLIFLFVLAADLGVLATWDDAVRRTGFDEPLTQMALALALVAGGFGLVTFLGVWLPVLAATAPVMVDAHPFWLRCPRCRAEQEALLGEHHCRRCGLRVVVELA